MVMISMFVFIELHTRLFERLGVIATAYLFFNYDKEETEYWHTHGPEASHERLFSSSWSADKVIEFYSKWFGGQITQKNEIFGQTEIEINGRSFVVTKQCFMYGKYQGINTKEGHWKGEVWKVITLIVLDDEILYPLEKVMRSI